ncbi:hypothetical protein [Microlunatus parietis]|uniref:Nucleotidyltransferase domain-containing protein n=1 Tax=Microlunatus parietis TaxID=682979 RepID=A0A7Y9LEF2_9ACTN|nr:hypothetical protein [Microlunatus parietis]NYE73783.1 hypothetical protein [Microlunatus parietis]
MAADPAELVERLTDWAERQPWVDWLELGGSLGRGAGDAWSDLDAGIGVTGDDLDARRDEAVRAVSTFAPVAGTLVQGWQSGSHCIVAYADGRQLSLVVAPADFRSGQPPESRALLDRTGRLATPVAAERLITTPETLREWGFLAWIAIGDAARHAVRGHRWRALRSLTEGRDLVWQLWGADHEVVYPAFGVVSVENAGLPEPPGILATHPPDLDQERLLDAAEALGRVLTELRDDHEVLAESIRRRIRDLRSHRSR